MLQDRRFEREKRNEENEEPFFFHQQREEDYEKIQQELITTKTENITIKEKMKQQQVEYRISKEGCRSHEANQNIRGKEQTGRRGGQNGCQSEGTGT